MISVRFAVAADVSKKYFGEVLLPATAPQVRRTIIYVSENDVALQYAKEKLNYDPLGLRPPLVKVDEEYLEMVEIIDATGISCAGFERWLSLVHSDPYMQGEFREVVEGLGAVARQNLVKGIWMGSFTITWKPGR